MASYGIPTQYMHGTNREACLERAVLVRARDLDERLHLLLLDLTLRTDYQQKASLKTWTSSHLSCGRCWRQQQSRWAMCLGCMLA
jgi:hypothetical protein